MDILLKVCSSVYLRPPDLKNTLQKRLNWGRRGRKTGQSYHLLNYKWAASQNKVGYSSKRNYHLLNKRLPSPQCAYYNLLIINNQKQHNIYNILYIVIYENDSFLII